MKLARSSAGNSLVDVEDATQRLQQLQQERDELAQQLTQLQPYLRSASTCQRDSSNVQCLVQGLQQLHELTEQSYDIATQHVNSSTTTISPHAAASMAARSPQQAARSGHVPHLEAEHVGLSTWGSGLQHASTSDGGSARQHHTTTSPSGHPQQQQQPLLTLTAPAGKDAAAPGILEEWGSGLWARSSSTGGAAAGSRLSPSCSGVPAASRLPSRLAVVSSVGAVELDSWGSGISPIHQQQQAGTAFAEEEDGLQLQAHLAASAALVAELQQQLADAQAQRQCLQQHVIQQHIEKQSLQEQVEQLQAFAQQQQDKLAHSEEIISRMQCLASRLATDRMSRDGSST